MKVYIIPFPEKFNYFYFCPRGHEIVIRGLQENGVELVSHPDEADFIFLTYVPHHGGVKWDTTDIKKYDHTKLVVIDWIDEPDRLLYPKFHRYFKRSLVAPYSHDNITYGIKYPTQRDNILPIAYCAMKEFFRPECDKDIDLACYLRPTCPNRIFALQSTYNAILENGIKSHHVGPASDGVRSTKEHLVFDTAYLQALARTKILVTCNPTHWEGDSRLWEAMANGCFVLSDRMFIDYPYKLTNNAHLIEYSVDMTEDLIHKISYFYKNLSQAQEIAKNGKDWVIKYHTESSRGQYILENL